MCCGPLRLLVKAIGATQGEQELLRVQSLLISFLDVNGLQRHPDLLTSTSSIPWLNDHRGEIETSVLACLVELEGFLILCEISAGTAASFDQVSIREQLGDVSKRSILWLRFLRGHRGKDFLLVSLLEYYRIKNQHLRVIHQSSSCRILYIIGPVCMFLIISLPWLWLAHLYDHR